MDNWKEIDIVGPYTTLTGYSEVTRNFVRGLNLLGWHVRLTNFERWAATPEVTDDLFKYVTDAKLFKSKLNLCFCLPEQADKFSKVNAYNGVYTMIESGGKLPDNWVKACRKLDYIIVPSNHSKTVFVNSGIKEYKVHVCPIGVNVSVFNSNVLPCSIYVEKGKDTVLLTDAFKYRFLLLQEIISRKNIWGAIEGWFNAYKQWDEERRENTCLFLKLNTNSGCGRYGDFQQRYDEMKKQHGINPYVFVYTDFWVENLLPNYLANFTHYLSASCGEGWDMTAAKMAAMKRCIIAPRSTSYVEYLNDKNAYLIDCEEKEFTIQEITARIYNNALWAVPKVDSLTEILCNDEVFSDNHRKSDYVAAEHNIIKSSYKLSERLQNLNNYKISINKPEGAEKHFMLYCQSAGQQCGIAKYNEDILDTMSKRGDKFIAIGGSGDNIPLSLEQYSIDYFINQCQYEFLKHPEWAKKTFDACHRRGVKVINIMHTYSREAIEFNDIIYDYSDLVIAHNPDIVKEFQRIGKDGNKALFIPYPCKDDIKTDLLLGNSINLDEDDNLLIGTFGFAYFHKGFHELLELLNYLRHTGVRAKLLLLANKPSRDQMDYSTRLELLIKEYNLANHVIWIKDYLSEDQIVNYLRKCKMIVLNYYDYGGLGSSATVRTVVKAKKPIIFLRKGSPFFKDIEYLQKDNYYGFEFYNDLNDIYGLVAETLTCDCTEPHQTFIDKFNINNFVDQLVTKCKELQ